MLISFVDTFFLQYVFKRNLHNSLEVVLLSYNVKRPFYDFTSFVIYLFIYLLLLFLLFFLIYFFEMIIVSLLWHGTNKLYTAHCLSFFCDMPERVLYGHLVIFLWHDTIVICVSFDVSDKGGASVADIAKKKLVDGFKGTSVAATNNTKVTSSSPIIVSLCGKSLSSCMVRAHAWKSVDAT